MKQGFLYMITLVIADHQDLHELALCGHWIIFRWLERDGLRLWERERERERERESCLETPIYQHNDDDGDDEKEVDDDKVLIAFYGISTIVGYLMPNFVNTYLSNIYDL